MKHLFCRSAVSSVIVFFSFQLLPFSSFAQKKQNQPGKVLLKNGQSLTGTVEYGAWARNPKMIVFTDSLNKRYELTPANASVIEITGKDSYHAAVVKRYMNSLDVNDLKDASYETEQELTEAVFLRELTKGTVLTLYSYRDEIKNHYFLKDRNDSIFPLRYVMFFNSNTMQVQSNSIYREQFLPYIIQNDEAEMLRRRAGWRNDDLIKLVKLINNDTQKNMVEVEAEKLKKENGLFAGAGLAFIAFRIESDHRFWGKYNFNNAVSFMPYVGYRLSAGRNIPVLSIQLLMGGYGYNTTGVYNWVNEQNQRVTETMQIQYKNLFIGSEGMVTVIKTTLLKGQAGLGINVNFALQANSSNTTNELQINGSLVGRDQYELSQSTNMLLYGALQATLLKKHTVRFTFRPGQKIDNTTNSRPKEQLFSLGYHFNFIKK